MHYKIHTQDSKGNSNTKSCSSLVKYLDKEEKNNWFNHEQSNIDSFEVRNEIDRYGKGQIKKDEWKFVEFEVNPSQKEQQIIIEKSTGRKKTN